VNLGVNIKFKHNERQNQEKYEYFVKNCCQQ